MRFTALLLCLGLIGLSGCVATEPDPRPNIIVVLVDDMGYSDPGFMGGDIRTPTLDRLARQGVLMPQFYNTAKCSPSRVALLTGQYAHTAGMGGNIAGRHAPPRPAGPYQGVLSTATPTIAEVLREAGYQTHMTGKWHVGEHEPHWPTRRGFDRYFGLVSGASSYYELITDQPRERILANDTVRWTPPAQGFYMTDAFADSASAFIDRHARTQTAPFFLYLPFTAPHWPLHADSSVIASYDGVYDDGWTVLHEQRTQRLMERGLLPEGLTPATQPADVPAWPSLSSDERATWARRMEVHAAMMTQMDAAVGRVMDTLAEHNMADNTLVLFLSDNGASAEDVTHRRLNDASVPIGARGSYDAFRKPWAWASVAPLHRYKLNLDEGGMRTPLVAYWPDGLGTEARVAHTPGHLIDLLPTILDASAATYLAPDAPALPGASLLDLWRGHRLGERPLFWEYNGHRAARTGDFKALYRRDERQWRLYNLAMDPAETTDLAAKHPAQLDSLTAQWHIWAESVGVFDTP